jgi:hypothetical protein
MRQTIHIFRKDIRHCWPYFAAVFGLTALHAWQGSLDLPGPQIYQLVTPELLLALPMFLAWWLTIGAVIHGESLVGERQFWTTRPYSWKSLLSAKLLFVAAFLALPLLISDCIILLSSGFNPLDLIPGLLSRQFWLLAFLVLPFVLAMLTRATHDFALAGLLSWFVFYIALSLLRPHSTPFPGMVHPEPAWLDAAAPWLAPVLALPLIVWQFARRRTVLVLVLAIVCLGAMPALAGFWIRIHWPGSPHEDPRYQHVAVQLAGDAAQATPVPTNDWFQDLVGMPLKFTGWPHDQMTRRVTVAPIWPGQNVTLSFTDKPDQATISTGSDGQEWIRFHTYNIVSTAKLLGKPARVNVIVNVEFDLFERELKAPIRPGRAWTHVPGFGNVKFLEVFNGGYPVCRTAIHPADSGWTYDLRDANTEFASDSAWSILLYDPSPSPVWFSASPVFSYAGYGVFSHPPAPGVRPPWGFSALHHDPSQPLVFTARHKVAKIGRVLIVPRVQLPSYSIKHR